MFGKFSKKLVKIFAEKSKSVINIPFRQYRIFVRYGGFMKKILIAAVCIMTVLLLFACNGKTDVKNEAVTDYEIEVNFSEEGLKCSQKTTVVNNYKEGLEELVFMLCPNAYSEHTANKAYITKLSEYGGLTVSSVSVDGVNVEVTYDEDKYYMTVPVSSMPLKERRVIDIKYEVKFPACNLRLGKSGDYYNVSNFYPQIATYSDEGFRKDRFYYIGDPIVSERANFSVTVKAPEEMVVACPGEVTESVADGVKTLVATEKNMRDFAFTASKNYTVKTCEKNGVTVKYYSVGERDYSETAGNVISTFSENFGEYPYKNYVVAETDFSAEGMEFSGMSFISDEAQDFENTVIHETVHQWFYNIVGSDNVNSPYLDEGLTTFMTEYYYSLAGQEEKFSAGMNKIREAYLSYERLQKMRGEKAVLAVNKSIYDYSEYSYSMLVYYKTAMMFDHLRETAGKSKFDKAIKNYVSANYFKWGNINSLTECLQKSMNCDVEGLINGWCENATTATFK